MKLWTSHRNSYAITEAEQKLIVRCMFHHFKLGSISCMMDDTTLINKMRHVTAQYSYRVM